MVVANTVYTDDPVIVKFTGSFYSISYADSQNCYY